MNGHWTTAYAVSRRRICLWDLTPTPRAACRVARQWRSLDQYPGTDGIAAFAARSEHMCYTLLGSVLLHRVAGGVSTGLPPASVGAAFSS